MIAWFIKFFSGFAIWKGQQLGKILWVAIISAIIMFSFYKVFLQKQMITKTEYRDSNITNVYNYMDCSNKTKDDTFSLIKLWRLRLLSVR
jgi:cell division protein FtsL